MGAALDGITLRDVHMALGAPKLVLLGFREDHPECLVAQVVNESLRVPMEQAESALLDRLGDITLAALAQEFGRRLRAMRGLRSPVAHRLEDHHAQH
jgi:DNA-binding IscR family transcriptional regulator